MKIFVIPEKERWVVKRENEEAVVSEHERKKDAFEAAKEVAMGSDAELVVLRPDGTIENLGNYEVDPFPSEDRAPEFNEDADEENI